MHRLTITLIVLFSFTALQLSAEKPVSPYAAPAQLPNVNYQMKTAGYWIARNPYPDSLIMTPEQISKYNLRIRKRSGAVSDISQVSTRYSAKTLQFEIRKQFNSVRHSHYVNASGNAFSNTFWDDMKFNLNIDSLPHILTAKRALVTSLSSHRVFPSNEGCYSHVGDLEFDNWQNTAHDIGTPIVCYFKSHDSQWYYTASATTIGWTLAKEIAICDEQTWQKYIHCPDFIVTTAPKSDVWLDSLATKHSGFVRMGTKFPLLRQNDRHYVIQIPVRDSLGFCIFTEGFIDVTDANHGYLAYTPRNALLQAFKLQNEAYGWGDSNGNWDCSSMINRIYATFGINLPRNGGFQEKAAIPISTFTKDQDSVKRAALIVKHGIGGICLLRMEGHIMIYLGSVNGIPYALHDVWAYRTSNKPLDDNVWVINKTVVSDLSLGVGSQKSSFLNRLTSLSILKDQ